MTFPLFEQEDFDVFRIPGLQPRMEALIRLVRPKLTAIGELLVPTLSAQCGEPMFPHVAKHARRTVHPPADSWVAWSNNRRGYKAHPHFQLGLWPTHLFVQFAIIYESERKLPFADRLEQQLPEVLQAIPAHFRWSLDHMQPETVAHADLNEEAFAAMADKWRRVKKAEAICGIHIERDDPILRDAGKLSGLVEQTFMQLQPLYRLA